MQRPIGELRQLDRQHPILIDQLLSEGPGVLAAPDCTVAA